MVGVKVLHMLHSIEHSGLESMLLSAVDAFGAAGVETHVLSTGAVEGHLAQRFREVGYRVHHMPFSASMGFFRALRALMRHGRFDVVHIHTEQAFFWYGLTARLAGVRRVVYHVHNSFPFEGGLRLERVVQRWLGRAFLGMTCLTVSRSCAENERSRFLNPSITVDNWVDAAAFHPVTQDERRTVRERIGLPGSALLIVSVGACEPRKNHALIVQSMPLVRTLVPDVHYVHVGSGPPEAAERDLAEKLGVSDRCHFLGLRDDVPSVLAACDVLVMPSEREGLPIAALEALSCGLPVVATDSPGLRDLIVTGQNGALVEIDAESLAAAVVCLLVDTVLRERLGAQGRRVVIEHHSPAVGVAAWLTVYRG